MEGLISIIPVLILVLIHLFAGKWAFLSGIPRSIWLSGAGGVSVAYIFLHLFPELSAGQKAAAKAFNSIDFLQHHIYFLALVGLSVFYGLERMVISEKPSRKSGSTTEKDGIFWVHIGSFTVYNALIGYSLFQREEGSLQDLILFGVAMALHFIINDFGLQERHKNTYRQTGRWLLSAAIFLGWGAGYFMEPSELAIRLIMAFIGGGIILNVLKEELPEERKSKYWAFLLGAGSYALLLMML